MNQLTQLMASCSFTSGVSVHDAYVAASHASCTFQVARSVGSHVFHADRQPLSCAPVPLLSMTPSPACTCVWMPAPGSGRHPPTHARTKLRKRPTLTSYLSSAKELTFAGLPASRLRTPS